MFSPDFTFDTSQSPCLSSSETCSSRETSRSVSPSTPTDALRFSVTDLADQLDRQRIRPEAQICYDSNATYANTEDDAGWSLPSDVSSRTRPRTVSARSFSPLGRQQRQMNSRLLCSSTHQRDIAALLSQMLESEAQCSVAPPHSLSHAATQESSSGDEAYDSATGDANETQTTSRRSSVATLKYRRATEFRATGASVSKEVRLRAKDRVHRRQKSGEKE